MNANFKRIFSISVNVSIHSLSRHMESVVCNSRVIIVLRLIMRFLLHYWVVILRPFLRRYE